MQGFFDDFQNTASSVWGGVSEKVSDMWDTASGTVTDEYNNAKKEVENAYNEFVKITKRRAALKKRINELPESEEKTKAVNEFKDTEGFFISTIFPAAQGLFDLLGVTTPEEVNLGALPLIPIAVIMAAATGATLLIGYLITLNKQYDQIEKGLPTVGVFDVAFGTQTSGKIAGALIAAAALGFFILKGNKK